MVTLAPSDQKRNFSSPFDVAGRMRTATSSIMRRISRRLPARRIVTKWLHLAMIPLVFWFVIATPEFVQRMFGPDGHELNSDIALLFVTLTLIWTVDVFFRGLLGRPGPKLSPRLKTFHRILHRALIVGLFLIPVGGFLLGLTSSRLLKAGGWLPIAPPMGWERANEIVGTLHIWQFYALGAVVLIHAAFHTWRHLHLRDNALRIMAPKFLHRFL